MSSFYIINKDCIPMNQPKKSIYSLDVNVSCSSIVNDSTSFVNNIPGFEGSIDPAGCTTPDPSQENHVITANGGPVEPKNIVIRTKGGAPTNFGSFFRDDPLITIKGDVRGGANDLSVSRTECSQVASGRFSSILGGKNNTASASNSVVVGGNSNIVSGVQSVAFGQGQVVNGFNSVSLTGLNNLNTMNDSIIFSGRGNTGQGNLNAIINSEGAFLASNVSRTTVIIGIRNGLIRTTSVLMGTGNGNVITRNNSAILSGQNNVCGPDNNNIIFTGIGNSVTNNRSGIVTGIGNILRTNANTVDNSCILSGLSNDIGGYCNKTIFTGNRNLLNVNSIHSAIITGESNVIPASASNTWIGTGIGNNAVSTQNTILSGSSNSFGTSIQRSVVITGINNTFNNGSFPNMWIGTGNSNLNNGAINSCVITGQNITLTPNSVNLNNSIFTGSNITIVGSNCGILSGSNFSIAGSTRFTAILSGTNHSTIAGRDAQIIGAGNNTAITATGSGFFANKDTRVSNSANSNQIVCSTSNLTASRSITGQSNGILSSSNLSASSLSRSAYISTSTSGTGTAISDLIIIGGSTNSNSSTLCAITSGSNNTLGTITNGCYISSGNGNTITSSTNTNSFVSGIGGSLSSLTNQNASSTFSQFNLEGDIGGSRRYFMVGGGTGTASRNNLFSVTTTGRVSARLVFSSGGADFGEYFESYSSTTLPIGETVCLIDETFLGKSIINGEFVISEDGFTENDLGKIMLSSDVPLSVEPFGVVVGWSGFLGNSYDEEWQGKYERDEDGNFIWDEVSEDYFEDIFVTTSTEVEEKEIEMKVSGEGQIYYEEKNHTKMIETKTPIEQSYPVYNHQNELIGNQVLHKKIKKQRTQIVKRISNSYDPNQTYIPRSMRPEWNLIALRGQVMIKEGQRLSQTFQKIRDNFYLI